MSDNGFISLGYAFSSNYGKLLENLVFTELQKADFEIFYFNSDFECGFIAKKSNKIIAIQVCESLTEETKKREINKISNDYLDEIYLKTKKNEL